MLSLLLVVSGCTNRSRQLDEEKYNAYLAYYQSILDYDNKTDSSVNFNIEVVANKTNGKYRYDLIIDDPKVSMYDIEVLMIVDNVTATINTEEMMPTIGIFEDDNYCMIPHQVDVEKGYYAGLDLSVVSEEPTIHISAMVSFANQSRTETYREYFTFAAAYTEE